jgi:hypothetical protein
MCVLVDPRRSLPFGLQEWNELLIQARDNALLGRVAAELRSVGILDRAPAKARDQMLRGAIGAESSRTAVRYEMYRTRRALGALDIPLILLKGAAYLAAELPTARGRMVGDLDFMVPRNRIDEVERALNGGGWVKKALTPYDERYYREFSHELPPLLHPERQTPLDVHHTIVPLTSRVRPNADALIADSIALGDSGWRVLAPPDMVLHSAVHLFNDEVGKPLRDLVDLRDLLDHFGSEDGFWDHLFAHARQHGLGRPLYYAVRFTQRWLGARVPVHVQSAMREWAPAQPIGALMDTLFARQFLPERLDRPRSGTAFARWLLYVRAHWLRMPPGLLVRHLAIKAAQHSRERREERRKRKDQR